MKAEKLFKNTGVKLFGNRTAEAKYISNDSRDIKKNSVFFAMAGSQTDGNKYIKQALEKGASIVVSEQSPFTNFPKKILWVKTKDLNKTLSKTSSAFYSNPSKKLKTIGITGTNGKTTVTYIIESVLLKSKIKTGVVGTINYRIDGKQISEAANTTPLAHTLHKILDLMVKKKTKAAAIEISSHSLSLKRADDIDFDMAIFTNLQKDHLDFHKNRNNYFKAKLKLFNLLSKSSKKKKVAAVNIDDDRARKIPALFKGKLKFTTFSVDKKADFAATDISILPNKTVFTMITPSKKIKIETGLLGLHNVSNILAASTALYSMGISLKKIAEGIKCLKNVPGRLQRAPTSKFNIFVDYAHTDAALINVLENLKKLPHKKLITVFGCGGDRDKTKRGPMGATACLMSDFAIVTDDNPRSENPKQIFSDILKGIKKGKFKNYSVIENRKKAIIKAVEMAGPDDIILIAGKGHENYQLLKTGKIHFDDMEEAMKETKKGYRGKGAG